MRIRSIVLLLVPALLFVSLAAANHADTSVGHRVHLPLIAKPPATPTATPTPAPTSTVTPSPTATSRPT